MPTGKSSHKIDDNPNAGDDGTLVSDVNEFHGELQQDETYPIILPIEVPKTPLPWRQLMLVFGLRAVKPLMFELIFPFVSECFRLKDRLVNRGVNQ